MKIKINMFLNFTSQTPLSDIWPINQINGYISAMKVVEKMTIDVKVAIKRSINVFFSKNL